ncbi:hypothetical protein ACEPAI_8351 [Sanghuangporus weigelae]
MARKKSTTTKTTTTTHVQENRLLISIQTVISLVALSLCVSVSENVLAPQYGSVATNLYLKNIMGTLIVALVILPLPDGLKLGTAQGAILGSLLCMAPATLHRFASLSTILGSPVLGPILAYTPVLAPIVFSATDGIRGILTGKLNTTKTLFGIAASVFVLQSQPVWSYIPFNKVMNQPILLLLSGWIVVFVGYVYSRSARARNTEKSNYGVLILPLFMTLLALSQPPLRTRSLPYTHPNGLLRIISSTPSVTGRIIVADDLNHGFRFLRADHSLLGGVWIAEKYLAKMDNKVDFTRDKDGTKLGESIYSAFVLQEAARLQERDKPHENALIIGLGVGIAAQAFMQHGLSTSIVEIDPAVYSAARDYFGVPEPSAAYIEDARSWVHRQTTLKNGTFDIIVHDCFSGGGVPAHLFTSEFWQDLNDILRPDGILAVNYAGVIGSESSKAVFLTLKQNFGQCRVFHDYKTQVPEEKLTSEFINLVFFCSPSSRPLSFRPATREDYLSSYLREHILQVLPDREVQSELILGSVSREQEKEYILTDDHNPLGAWQDEGALDHWKVMRSVLPDYVWSTY